jgi:hypothetical protein
LSAKCMTVNSSIGDVCELSCKLIVTYVTRRVEKGEIHRDR